MADAKMKILAAACRSLEKKGFHATSMNDIVKESGAPKGSLYYYFPGGKDEIAAEAILASGEETAERIRANLKGGNDFPTALGKFTALIAEQMETSGFSAGSPLSVVAAETSTQPGKVHDACQKAYRSIIGAVQEALEHTGMKASAAAELANFIISTIEGGILLGRCFHSQDPLLSAGGFLQNTLINQNIKEVQV